VSTWPIKEHDRCDDENIFELQQLVYPEHHLYKDREKTRLYWQWRYFSNPTAPSKIFVAKTEDTLQIAGMRPVTFQPLRLLKRDALAVQLTAVITHPDFRRQGIFSNLVKHSMADARQAGAEFAFTFPNKQSYAIYKKKPEWRYLAAVPLYLKPLGLSVGRPAKHKATRFKSRSGSDIRLVDRFDEGYDALWQKVDGTYPIAVRRDAAFLNWRYGANPVADYTIIEAREPVSDQVKGYIVTAVQQRNRMPLGLIIDLLVEGEEPAVSGDLIRAATVHFKTRRAGLGACLISKTTGFRQSLLRCGYLPVPNWLAPKRFHMICSDLTGDADFGRFIADFRNWYLTWGDTDNV
jgi:GNAT superfamily N-acetyltransferase